MELTKQDLDELFKEARHWEQIAVVQREKACYCEQAAAEQREKARYWEQKYYELKRKLNDLAADTD